MKTQRERLERQIEAVEDCINPYTPEFEKNHLLQVAERLEEDLFLLELLDRDPADL